MANQDPIGQFATRLRQVRREDGDTPYRDLTRRMSNRYSIASISRALSGTSFPRWEFTRGFLRACNVTEEEISNRWFTTWYETANLVSPVGEIPHDSETGTATPVSPAVYRGSECPECGAWVINPLRHRAWHATHLRREPLQEARQLSTGTDRPLRSLSS